MGREDRVEGGLVERLLEKRVRHLGDERSRRRREGPPRDEHDAFSLLRVLFGDGGVEVHPGHVGHHQVAEDDVEAFPCEDACRDDAWFEADDDVVIAAQPESEGARDVGVVVDDEEATAAKRGRSHRRGRILNQSPSASREVHPEGGSLTGDTVDLDAPSETVDDAIADRKAEAGAHADRLRREERLEDTSPYLRRYARASVLDGDHDHALGVVAPRRDTNLVLVRPPLGDGLGRIQEEVHEDLAETEIVGEYGWHGIETPHETGAMSDDVVGHLERAFEHDVDVDRLRTIVILSRKGAQSADDAPHAIGPLARLVHSLSKHADL